MPQAVGRYKSHQITPFAAGMALMFAIPACSSMQSAQKPLEPRSAASVAASPQSASEPDLAVIADSDIPAAPAATTASYDSDYSSYWAQTQNGTAKTEPRDGVAGADGFSAETFSVVDIEAPPQNLQTNEPVRQAGSAPQLPPAPQPYPVASTINPSVTTALPAMPAPAVATPAVSGRRYGLHLASYRLEENAIKGWSVLQQHHGEQLSGLAPQLIKVDLAQKGQFLRLVALSYPTRSDAESVCVEIAMTGDYCKVVVIGEDY